MTEQPKASSQDQGSNALQKVTEEHMKQIYDDLQHPKTRVCDWCKKPIPNDDLHKDGLCDGCREHPARKEFFENLRKAEEQERLHPTKHYPGWEIGFEYNDPERGIFKPARVARWIAQNEHFKTDRKTDLLWYGDEQKGSWSRDGETKLREIVSQILGDEDKKHHFENILHTLKSLTYCDLKFSQKVACENGILDPETGELSPFTLDEMALHTIECSYDKNSECPEFQKFLRQILNPEDAATLQEWSGYLLLPDYRFHKLLWIHGQGRNGKGVWQRTMEGILGEQNVSGIGLEELDGNHRFALECLYGKLFNPCSEPTTNRILQTSLLKKATGQDTIEAEIKGRQKRIKFRNTAKITVLANKFPKVRDETLAFRERRLFITFPNEFIGKNCIENLEKNWLENPAEKSGILNWMLQGLQRLLSNHCFTESKSQDETEILFERASDSIGAFLKEMAIYGRNYVTFRNLVFDTYKEYCEVFGLDQESDKKFTQRLKETRGITPGKRVGDRIWKGVTFREITEDGEIRDPVSGADRADGARSLPSHTITDQNIEEYSKCAPCAPNAPNTIPDFDDQQPPGEDP